MSVTGAIISGVGSSLPQNIVTNDALVDMGVDTNDEWIRDRSGIGSRHIISGDESTLSLAVAAGRAAIANAGMDASDIELVLVATSTQEYAGFPSTACLVQEALDIPSAAAFDIAAACTGFNYALTTAQQYILSGMSQHVGNCGNSLSNIVNWSDRATCVLFGDGAGAVVVSQSDSPGILSSRLYSDGSLGAILKLITAMPVKPFLAVLT